MIQTIDFAPLDGITKIVFRQVWSQFFGGGASFTSYAGAVSSSAGGLRVAVAAGGRATPPWGVWRGP